MDNKKFEQLIELIINENEEQAKALFHDIVVEKSREIYESMMADEMDEASGQVMDMMNEIGAEEEGMTEEEDDLEVDAMDDDDGEVVDIEADDEEGMEGGEEDLEDRVVDLEDKLDQLMAEFEEIMGAEEAEHGEDFGDEEGEEDFGGEEDMMEAADDEEDEEDTVEESVMEAVQLKQVGGSSYDKFGKMGDDGANTKSIALTKPKVVQTGAKPVNVAGSPESVPTSPKAPSNYGTKGETQVKGAGTFKNAPGSDNFKEKGESAPKPTTSQASGVNDKSPVAESRKTTKKRV